MNPAYLLCHTKSCGRLAVLSRWFTAPKAYSYHDESHSHVYRTFSSQHLSFYVMRASKRNVTIQPYGGPAAQRSRQFYITCRAFMRSPNQSRPDCTPTEIMTMLLSFRHVLLQDGTSLLHELSCTEQPIPSVGQVISQPSPQPVLLISRTHTPWTYNLIPLC